VSTLEKPLFKVWTSHYDFSEINRTNFKTIFQCYFKLTTKKITLLAMLLVLNILFNFFSKFLLGSIPGIGGFLTFNVTIWTIFIAYIAFNFFYSFILLEITTWFRLLYDPNIPGIIAINLNDLTFLFFLAFFVFVINIIRFRIQKDFSLKKRRITYYWTLLVGLILALFVTASFDVLYNWGFMIDLYNKMFGLSFNPGEWWLLITIFWFNLVQGLINIGLFSLVFKPAYFLINLYFAN